MNRRLYNDPTTKSKQSCLRKNAIGAEHASKNMMPMEVTPFNPPYSKGGELVSRREGILSFVIENP